MAYVQAESLSEKEHTYGSNPITLMDKVDEVLRNKFHQNFPIDPTDLYSVITKHGRKLKTLLKQNIITRSQYNIFLPSTGKTISSKFDTSLLTLSLRVFCPLKMSNIGLELFPLSSDQSDEAVLFRSKLDVLNNLCNLQYKSKIFQGVWDRLSLALLGLGCDKQEIIDLLTYLLTYMLQMDYERKLEDYKNILKFIKDLEDSHVDVVYNLNLSVPSFVGRERELSEIHQKLLDRDESQLGMVIHGISGVGKSELARQYLQRYAASLYIRNVIWINAENENTMTVDFFNVAKAIMLDITDESNKQLPCKAVVRKLYKFFADRPVLFVFDNVIDKNDFMEFVEHDISPNISVLITSQCTEWDERFIQTRIYVLSKKAAFELVSQHLTEKHVGGDENVHSLCKTLQYLPLALQQAISYIKKCSLTIAEYLQQFNSSADKVMATSNDASNYEKTIMITLQYLPLALQQAISYIKKCSLTFAEYLQQFNSSADKVMATSNDASNCDKTIMVTWNMALQKLKEENNSSLAITLINMMSYLDGTSIKKELFYEYYDEHSVKEALKLLEEYCLITATSPLDDSDSQQSILMHSLLQHVIRIETAHDYLQEFLDMIFSNLGGQIEIENGSYGLGRHWWYHLVYIFSKEEYRNRLNAKTVQIINMLLPIFTSKGKTVFYLQLLTAIEKIQIDSNDTEILSILTTQENIAKSLSVIGNYDDALDKYMEIEMSRIELFGCKDSNTMYICDQIAECFIEKENYVEAMEKYKELEKVKIEIHGSRHPSTAATQVHIAFCLQCMGDHYEALDILTEAEKSQIEILGRKDERTLRTQFNIAKCLIDLDLYHQALRKHMEIKDFMHDKLGSLHPIAQAAQDNIAYCYEKIGYYDQALAKYEEILEFRIFIYGSDHPDTQKTQQNIRRCLRE